MSTCMRAYIPAYWHECMPTYIHTCIRIRICTYTRVPNTCIHADVRNGGVSLSYFYILVLNHCFTTFFLSGPVASLYIDRVALKIDQVFLKIDQLSINRSYLTMFLR